MINKKTFMVKKILWMLIAFVFIFNIFDIKKSHNWGDDFSGYIGQAKSIVEGDVKFFSESSERRVLLSESQVGPKLYPWGYPLILSFFIFCFGLKIELLKFFTFIFFVGSVGVSYFLFRKRLSENMTLLLLLFFSVSPAFFYFKQNILSDVPAMFFTLLSLLLIQIAYFGKKDQKSKFIFALLGGVMFASIFVRTSSVVIIPTLFLVQILKWKEIWADGPMGILKNGMPYAVIVLAYFFFGFIFPESSYAENHTLLSSNSFNIAWSNLKYYFLIVPVEFFGDPKDIVNQLFYFMSIPIFIFGIITGFRKNYLFLIYAFIMIALLLIYPYKQGIRFAISLVPIYLFFVFLGFGTIKFKDIEERIYKGIVYSIFLTMILFFVNSEVNSFRTEKAEDGPYTKNAKELFQYIKKNTDKNATIAFFKPRAMHLFSGRESVRIDSPDFLSKSNADYYVFTEYYNTEDLRNYLNINNDLVFKNDTFSLYNLK